MPIVSNKLIQNINIFVPKQSSQFFLFNNFFITNTKFPSILLSTQNKIGYRRIKHKQKVNVSLVIRPLG